MPDVEYRIRPVTPGDVPVVLDLIRQLAEYERMQDQVVATEDSLRESLFGRTTPAVDAAIAWLGDEPAGFALWFYNYSTFLSRPGLYLEDLFVLPQRRGRGIGKALLTHLARIAVERGCGRMEWSVLDWNTPAIQFYQSLGAVPMNEWTVYRLTGDALARLGHPDAGS